MRATLLRPGVVHLTYATQRALCEAMVRLQEFYESPYDEVRNHEVDLPTLVRLYSADHGDWTYNTDWHGFNVPGDVVDAFFEKHESLLDDEECIRDALTLLVGPDERYYVIATHADDADTSTLAHELAHAYWYLDPNYRARAVDLLRQARLSYPAAIEALAAWLLTSGYAHAVLDDELHAYLATTPVEWWTSEDLPADLWNAGHDLRALYGGK